MRLAALIAVLALALAAGCGGEDGDANPSPTNGDAAVSGEEVFSGNCASCHALEAAGSSGGIGPDLDEAQASRDRIEEQVRRGGGGMPAFEGRLSDEEIGAVSDYVAESTGG